MKTHERMFHHDHAHKLDDPERERWLPIADVLARLALRPGMVVADVGAGTGYFALPIAKVVAPSGPCSRSISNRTCSRSFAPRSVIFPSR